MGADSTIRTELRTRVGSWRNRHVDELPSSCDSKSETCFDDLRLTIAPLRKALLKHSLYTKVDSLDRLREFIRIHVFAVLGLHVSGKAASADLTSHQLPWTPPGTPELARFANEVVLGEESDLGPDGRLAGCPSRASIISALAPCRTRGVRC